MWVSEMQVIHRLEGRVLLIRKHKYKKLKGFTLIAKLNLRHTVQMCFGWSRRRTSGRLEHSGTLTRLLSEMDDDAR